MKKKALSIALACSFLLQAPAGIYAASNNKVSQGNNVINLVEEKELSKDNELAEKYSVKIIAVDIDGEETIKEVKEINADGILDLESKDETFEKWVIIKGNKNYESTNKKLTISDIKEDLVVKEIHKKTVENIPEKDLQDYLTNIKYINGVKEGKLTLELPDAKDGYAAEVMISNNNKEVMKLGITKGKNVNLDYVKTPYTVTVKLVRVSDKIESKEVSKTLKNPTIDAPKLNYAYVYDGGVVINVSADMGIKDIFWTYDGERDFTKLPSDDGYGRKYSYRPVKENTNNHDFSSLFRVKEEKLDKYTKDKANDYRINLKIPSKVNIVVIDKMGNETPITLKVEKDNEALTKNVPEDVLKALKSITNFTFTGEEGSKYEDLMVVEKGTVVDMFEVFEKYIVKELDSFNTRDLSWTFTEDNNEKENIPYTGVYKFNKSGVFTVEVKDNQSNKSTKITIVVNEGKNNLKNYKVKDKNIEIKNDKFKGVDALNITKYDDKKDINALSLLLKVDKKYYKITDEIPFGDKEKVEAEIIDLKDDKTYSVTFIKKPIVTASELTDIKGHWAEEKIKELVNKGVIFGYEDKTFKPDQEITIRETLSILGRYAQRNEDYAKAELKDHKLLKERKENGKLEWSFKEATFAANRLPVNIFEGQDISKDYITREQVAYVMDALYKLDAKENKNDLKDLKDAKYKKAVNDLYLDGIIKGYPDKTFKPQNKITRAELSSLLFNMPKTYK